MRAHWFGSALAFGLTMIVAGAQPLEPIVFTISAPAPETHVADIEVVVPTAGRTSVELMMPVWSPGFYGVGNYARNVQQLSARTADGVALAIDRPKENHWRIDTMRAPKIVVAYRLQCQSRFVTGCWIGADSAVLNGSVIPNGDAATGWFRYSTTNPESCNDSFGVRTTASVDRSLGAGVTAVAYSARRPDTEKRPPGERRGVSPPVRLPAG